MTRFADRKDVKKLIKQSGNFTKRRYVSIIKWISFCILGVAFGIALNVNRTLYDLYTGVDMVLASDVLFIIFFMAIITSAVICYLLIALKKNRNVLNAVEFQSLLLSSTARYDTKFLVILSPCGEVVFSDRKAPDIFSIPEPKTIDDLIKSKLISQKHKEMMRDTITTSKPYEYSITYPNQKDKGLSLSVLIAPIEKPKGYFLIKGVCEIKNNDK